MKTKQNKNQNSGLKNRPDEQQSENNNTRKTFTQAMAEVDAQKRNDQPATRPARVLPFVNFTERDKNRSLPTDKVLDLLHEFLPTQYDLAEVVGKWIWISFPEPPSEQIRGQLSQFGFHWNNVRKCWQHPCGQFATQGSTADPREKYGSRFVADSEPNPHEYNGPPRTAEQVAA